jgi:predicted transglutaminase-like cysteine proteinase
LVPVFVATQGLGSIPSPGRVTDVPAIGRAAVLLPAAILVFGLVLADEFRLSESLLQRAHDDYGYFARNRLVKWQDLINQNRNRAEREKLDLVNDFFNGTILATTDRRQWGAEDYWATPVETLVARAGDCEDFVIAKYFTLRELGVPDERLRLTYVRALRLGEPHMVLTWYETRDADPLVLDNVSRAIRPASQRSDLVPVYSFNGENLWMSKERGRGEPVGSSGRISRWQEVLTRMGREGLR